MHYLAVNPQLNIIGLDRIELLTIFEIRFKSVYNTFNHTSVSDFKNHYTDKLKNNVSDAF